MIPVLPTMKCNDIKCKLPDHRHETDILHSQICCSVKQSSIDSMPSSKVHITVAIILFQGLKIYSSIPLKKMHFV